MSGNRKYPSVDLLGIWLSIRIEISFKTLSLHTNLW